MRKRALAFFFVVFLMPTLLFSGCLRENNNFVYDLEGAPKNLDPQSAADAASRLVIANLFEGLVTIGENGSVCPGAAESWDVSVDGLTYTFQLREDGKWSDGQPVTAADFVYGFQRLFDPATNAPGAADFTCIEEAEAVLAGEPAFLGVTALGKYSLQIRLSRYNGLFLELLSTAPAMPCRKDFFLETKGKYGLAGNKILGNGAFYLSSWSDSGTVKLRPSATYYDRAAVTATSLTLAVPSSGTTFSRFREGITSAAALSGAEMLALGDVSGLSVESSDSAVWGLIFRTDREPFSNEKIRKALFLDGDFSTMEKALPDYYQRVEFVIPQNAQVGGKTYRALAGTVSLPALDREGAVALFREGVAELENGISGLRLILPKDSGHEENFAYLSQIWQRDLGLYLTVEALSAGEYEKRLAAGDYDCALVSLSGNGRSPEAALSVFRSVYVLPELSALLDAASVEPDAKKAAGLYRQAEELLIGEGLFLPFYSQTEYFVSAAGVTGVTYRFDSRQPDFRYGKIG